MFRVFGFQLIFIATAFATCPNFKTDPDLDLTKYAVDWQIHGIIEYPSTPVDRGFQCWHMNIKCNACDAEPATMKFLIHGEVTSTDSEVEGTYIAKIPSLKNPGSWEVESGGLKYEYSVLQMDSNYSLSVACHSSEEDGLRYSVFIKSKSQEPIPLCILDQYKSLVDTYRVNGDNFQKVVQNDEICHEHDHPEH